MARGYSELCLLQNTYEQSGYLFSEILAINLSLLKILVDFY